MSWSPDSRWLILPAREPTTGIWEIWRVFVETGERQRVLPPLQKLNLPSLNSNWAYGDILSRLSPSGRVLVFVRSLSTFNNSLYTVRLTSDLLPEAPPQKLRDQDYPRQVTLDWVSDREIVFSDAVWLFRMPVSGGSSPRRLTWCELGAEPTISRSKHRLAYSRGTANIDVWQHDLRTGEQRLIVGSSYEKQYPQYSPDGHRIAFHAGGTLWTCQSEGENCQQLTSFGGSVGGTPRWSADGRWLAFDSREEGKSNIYTTPADGGPRRRVTSGNADNMIPSWSHNGRWVYFNSDRTGHWRVWKAPSAGGEAVQVTHTGGGGAAFESVDGSILYFISDQADNPVPAVKSTPQMSFPRYALFRVPVEGGEERQIATVPDWASLSVTSKGVYFLSDPRTLRLFNEKTVGISTVARLGQHTARWGISVSPDDRYLVFSDGEGRRDLMLVEGFR